jgi:hypothetical protein
MSEKIADLRGKLRRLEREIDTAIEQERARIEREEPRGKPGFSGPVRSDHRAQKIGVFAYLAGMRPLFLLAVLPTYALLLPIALLDVMASFYQWTSFPIFGIRRVRRADYVAIDRHRLGYLNAIEKLNCLYCGYANGVLAYVREIASRTEQYWCPIKHAKLIRSAHRRYAGFLEYGDAKGYKARLRDFQGKADDL